MVKQVTLKRKSTSSLDRKGEFGVTPRSKLKLEASVVRSDDSIQTPSSSDQTVFDPSAKTEPSSLSRSIKKRRPLTPKMGNSSTLSKSLIGTSVSKSPATIVNSLPKLMSTPTVVTSTSDITPSPQLNKVMDKSVIQTQTSGQKPSSRPSLTGTPVINSTSVKVSTAKARVLPPSDPNHDAFVREFAIPTNLYRYLAQRHSSHPIILHRCLSYMKHKRVQSSSECPSKRCLGTIVERLNKTGGCEKVKLVSPGTETISTPQKKGTNEGQFKFTFNGFFDSEKEKEWTTVQASLSLYAEHRWCHPRKPSKGRHLQPLITDLDLVCNASEDAPDQLSSAKQLVFSLEDLTEVQMELCRLESSLLVFKVRALEKKIYSKVYDSPPGRRKSAKKKDVYPVCYRAALPLSVLTAPPPPSSTDDVPICDLMTSSRLLKASPGEVQLKSGEYEVRLEVDSTGKPLQIDSPQKAASDINTSRASTESDSGLDDVICPLPEVEWLSTELDKSSDAVKEYTKWPVIRFQVVATSPPSPQEGHQTRDCEVKDVTAVHKEEMVNGEKNRSKDTDPLKPRTKPLGEQNTLTETISVSTTAPKLVSYRFLFHGQVAQWSEVRTLVCPWCRVSCTGGGLSALLMHIRCWHPRFTLSAGVSSDSWRARLEIGVARHWLLEGDVWTDIGLRRSRTGPVRRASCSAVIWCRGRSQTNEKPTSCIEKVIPVFYAPGHSRQYNHTWTSLPVEKEVFSYDSEDEDTLRWLHQHYHRIIEEFTDVNMGEKQVMQLWNKLLIREHIMGDCQVPLAVDLFITQHGAYLMKADLRRNVLLHLSSLADYGLITPEVLESAVVKLDTFQTTPSISAQ